MLTQGLMVWKWLEGDNRLWMGVMEPSGGTGSCLAYVLIISDSVGLAVFTTKRTRDIFI